MSVAVILQALGWVSVVWLVTVHLMIQRGRLPEDSVLYRMAGCAAAGSVVAASVAEGLWPVAVLGLLWLRIEVFGHRHHLPECRPEAEPEQHGALGSGHHGALGSDQHHALGSGQHPAPEPERMPALLASALGQRRPAAEHPSHHPHRPHPHLPHPHLARRTVDRVFKVEMAIVIIVAVVLFGIWAEQQRVSFKRDSNHVICNWIDGC